MNKKIFLGKSLSPRVESDNKSINFFILVNNNIIHLCQTVLIFIYPFLPKSIFFCHVWIVELLGITCHETGVSDLKTLERISGIFSAALVAN